MRYDDFLSSPAGQLVPTLFGEQAFVPNALPPTIDMTPLVGRVGSASAAIGQLRGACRLLRNPNLLIRPLQRLEAQTSSALEGTYTTSDELAYAEAGYTKDATAEAREVANYGKALTWAKSMLPELPISGRLMKGAHEILMRGVGSSRGQDKRPGEFKRDQNMIGANPALSGKERLRSARFVPPPRNETIDAVTDLERYINRTGKEAGTALIDLALVHYQFETIHPFDDGNGRVGRMLISLMAITEGIVDLPVFYMSPELEARKDAYIDLMYRVSAEGAWLPWIGFFLETAAESALRAVKTIDAILSLQEDYRGRASAISRSNNLLAIIDMLFEVPVVQARDIVEKLRITDAASRVLLRQLVELGILVENRAFYPTAWVASELITRSQPTG
jgi:Fic family protein